MNFTTVNNENGVTRLEFLLDEFERDNEKIYIGATSTEEKDGPFANHPNRAGIVNGLCQLSARIRLKAIRRTLSNDRLWENEQNLRSSLQALLKVAVVDETAFDSLVVFSHGFKEMRKSLRN